MFVVNNYTLAVVFCFVTMLCWGSWGNTQKLASKSWRYELFYWDMNGWVSLGQQQAEDLTLTFDKVPDNALLILRNWTRGRDERIFIYENDRQIWY